MPSYYIKHEGDLFPGHIARSEDINMVQDATNDAITNAVMDMTEGQSWIIGENNQADKDAFLLTPDVKRNGRYVDQMVIADGDDLDFVSIRETDYRQPLKLSRSSVYSVIVKMQNKSEVSVPVNFSLHDEYGNLIPNMKTILNLPKETNTPTRFEIVFDLEHYPTCFGKDPEDLAEDNQALLNINTDEEDSGAGELYEAGDLNSSTAGASVIYLHVEALNKSKDKAFNVNSTNSDGYQWNDDDPTFGLAINKNSTYGQLLEENSGSGYVTSSKKGDLHFEVIYANAPTYKCNFGQAIIGGEKVALTDTHVTVNSTITEQSMNEGNIYGNILSFVYMDKKGHLRVVNSDPFLGDEPIRPIPTEVHYLHIADIITYFNDYRDPLIIQDDERQDTRPRSHHERLRRLEKKMGYIEDISVPPRFKCTLTEDDWIDENPNLDFSVNTYNGMQAQEIDSLKNDGYVITTDANGNFIVKVTKNESFSIPITLQSESAGKVTAEKDKTKIITTAQTSTYINELNTDDPKRAQTFAEIKNMKNNVTDGTLELETQDSNIIVATTKKEAELTEFNPWDDAKENRPADANVKPTTREYTVTAGRNAANDWASEFVAMTLYTDTEYKLMKLQLPIYKFKNCESVKFIIWKRQGPNNKDNSVWLEKKIKTSKTFSLKNAKKKGGYQYMEEGFIWDFGKDGLKLPKGQYVIVCFPTVKSGKGTVYVDTYKPKKSKDFCIRYHGAANGSHFLKKTAYQEVWYNSAKAQMEKIKYSKTGSIESGTVSWTNKEPIKTVKPILNLSTPKNTEATVSVDVGGGWVKVTPDKDNSVVGSGSGESFKWKIEFKSNSKDTPIIKYDKDKKYAILFEITRVEPNATNVENLQDLTKNLCITSKPFDANEILRDYIGDMNFNLDDNKFSNYEFARIWATNEDNKLLVDISASDQKKEVYQSDGTVLTEDGKQVFYPLYSLHYVDLTLEDIPQISVDYNNYDPFLEEDEHNLRLKLDTENSYNDNDVKIANHNNFEFTNSNYGSKDNNKLRINLDNIPSSDENQIIAKATFESLLNLSKYEALKIGFKLDGTVGGTLSGLGLYISSQSEVTAPSNSNDEEEEILNALPDGLPDLNVSQQETIDTYANKIVYREVPYNGTAATVYYRSVWNSTENKWEWEMLHNMKAFNIYKIIQRGTNSETLTITEDNIQKEQYVEIEIDPDSLNLQYAREIGIVLLNENGEYQNTNVSSITLGDISAIQEDYYKAFCAKDGNKFDVPETNALYVVSKSNGNLAVQKNSTTYTETYPPTSSIKITHQAVPSSGHYLCHFDMTTKSTKGFNHIGLQLGTDCILTKHMLELHLRKKDNLGNMTVIEKIKIPTINHIYYPITSNQNISLSQIFKKIKTTEKFDEISLYATPKFKAYAGKLKSTTTTTEATGNTEATTTTNPNGLGSEITIYIGNIVLYKAETIPFVYPVMRMKFYFDEIDEITKEKSGIRKIGTIIQYK